MKPEFQAKFLQYMVKQRQETGFTIAQILFILVVLGILVAIALPSFLNSPNKCCGNEAKQNISSMNRAQQAYYLENGAFTSTVENLGLGITTQTTKYIYTIDRGIVTNTRQTYVINQAISRKAHLSGYSGRVDLGTIPRTTEVTTFAVVCEAKEPGVGVIAKTVAATKTSPPDCDSATSRKLDTK